MYKGDYMKKGFTLSELLIVVLIIGILAGIALPQYQLAVDKAQFSNFQRLVKSIQTAYDSYFLVNENYPASFNEIDIDFSAEHVDIAEREGCVIFSDSYCCVGKSIQDYQDANIICGKNDYSFAYSHELDGNFCAAANENQRANRLCTNVSHNFYGTYNIITPYGHNNNSGKRYSWYRLK